MYKWIKSKREKHRLKHGVPSDGTAILGVALIIVAMLFTVFLMAAACAMPWPSYN